MHSLSIRLAGHKPQLQAVRRGQSHSSPTGMVGQGEQRRSTMHKRIRSAGAAPVTAIRHSWSVVGRWSPVDSTACAAGLGPVNEGVPRRGKDPVRRKSRQTKVCLLGLCASNASSNSRELWGSCSGLSVLVHGTWRLSPAVVTSNIHQRFQLFLPGMRFAHGPKSSGVRFGTKINFVPRLVRSIQYWQEWPE